MTQDAFDIIYSHASENGYQKEGGCIVQVNPLCPYDFVPLQDYKDVATGPTYYDTADEVDEAVAQAEEEDNRFDIAKERAEQLIAVYNAFVPWVLRMCNKRIDDLEESVHGQRRGSVGAAQAAEDEEQLGAIVQTLQCLSANVEEARPFLGKMGKTKERGPCTMPLCSCGVALSPRTPRAPCVCEGWQ